MFCAIAIWEDDPDSWRGAIVRRLRNICGEEVNAFTSAIVGLQRFFKGLGDRQVDLNLEIKIVSIGL